MGFLKQFLLSEEGPTAVEYAVMLALIIGTLIGTLGTLGATSGGLWGSIDTDLQNQGFGS
ncbi:MAG: Flp family type IVb pilin [Pirellulales bacterium]